MNWYKFDISKYIRDTSHIGDADDLCYRRLIDLYYLKEAPLFDNLDYLADAVRMPQDVVEGVLEEFFDHTPLGWRHEVIQADIDRRKRRTELNRASGKKGGRPRLTKDPS